MQRCRPSRRRQTYWGKYLIDCTLYVTVEPLPMCAGALRWPSSRLYGATDERGATTLTAEMLHPKTEVTAGVMAEECGELMKQFFARRR